eukprot:9587258-Alexandrium_andersonii.AAC.1
MGGRARTRAAGLALRRRGTALGRPPAIELPATLLATREAPIATTARRLPAAAPIAIVGVAPRLLLA